MTATIHSQLDDLIEKYKDHPHVIAKLHHYVGVTLPNLLSNHHTMCSEREKQKKHESDMCTQMVNKFSAERGDYYYCSASEVYFMYNRVNYVTVTEDYIRDHIYTTLTKDKVACSLKYKLMRMILKTIRERNIAAAIPESGTIQDVMGWWSSGNSEMKNFIKYFLTILGDAILKKDMHLTYMISPKMKPLMRELANRCYEYFGGENLRRRFKYKFHEQYNISDSRLLTKLEIQLDVMHAIRPLDMLCVALHYSSRYGSSEKFLNIKSYDCDLCNYVLYFKIKNSTEAVIKEFVDGSLIKTDDDDVMISMKNMLFLWKRFCEQNSIPSVIFYGNLKLYLQKHFDYDEAHDTYLRVTSPYLPIVSQFLKFWGECTSHDSESEYEIEEVCNIYRVWSEKNVTGSISESMIMKLIHHFFEDNVTIEEDKYIYGVNFLLWDKKSDVLEIMQLLKEERSGTSIPSLTTLYNAYERYQNYQRESQSIGIVSKRFFERCILEKFPNAIRENNQGIRLLNWDAV